MNFRYFSGLQEIQRDAILECCGGITRTWDEDGEEQISMGSTRAESECLLELAEQRAMSSIGRAVPVTIAGSIYKVLCK